jgi:hypothetical protein
MKRSKARMTQGQFTVSPGQIRQVPGAGRESGERPEEKYANFHNELCQPCSSNRRSVTKDSAASRLSSSDTARVDTFSTTNPMARSERTLPSPMGEFDGHSIWIRGGKYGQRSIS